jgi:hypothetical protein
VWNVDEVFFKAVAVVTPFLKISLGAVRQKDCPCPLKAGAGIVQANGCSAGLLSRVTARVKAAAPTPWVGIPRIAGPTCQQADAHAVIVDVPKVTLHSTSPIRAGMPRFPQLGGAQ